MEKREQRKSKVPEKREAKMPETRGRNRDHNRNGWSL